MEDNSEEHRPFCYIHQERTQDIVEIKQTLKEIKEDFYVLELKLDKQMEQKVSWATFRWVIGGVSAVLIFIVGTQLTVFSKKDELMTKADFYTWKVEREERLTRIEDRLLSEITLLRSEVKELSVINEIKKRIK